MTAHVLVVEDTPHNLELVTYLLEKAGYDVGAATTGAQALAHVARRQPDIVLLDVQLPDASGFEVLAALRADADLRHVPVLAVTANAMLGDRENALQAGFSGYVTKPIDPRTFTATVESHLQAARPEIPVAADPLPHPPVPTQERA